MGVLVILAALAIAAVAAALGWAADSRSRGPWYPVAPDADRTGR